MSEEREERVNAVLIDALEGVSISGAALVVGGSDGVARALATAGLAVHRWDRFGRNATALPDSGSVGSVDRIALRLPRGRRNLLAMVHVLAARLADGGRLWLHGANDEGIKSSDSTLREVFGEVEKIDSRKHGRLWAASSRTGDLRDLWDFVTRFEANVGGRTLELQTLPGVFADGRVDEGTERLLQSLNVEPGARVLDFGCGAGVIGAWLRDVTEQITGYDIDAWALACAERNAPGTYRVCDGWSDVEGTFDHIVSNPPFHVGKDTDFRVMDDLIAGARDRLSRHGKLTFVCPATTSVHAALKERFKDVRCLSDDRRYKVWEAKA